MDLIVVSLSCTIIVLLGCIHVSHTKRARNVCQCISNILLLDSNFEGHALGISNRTWPPMASTNVGGTREYSDFQDCAWMHFSIISNYSIDPNVLVCPDDVRRPASQWPAANSNISYFITIRSDSIYPTITLGCRNIVEKENTIVRLRDERLRGWNVKSGLHSNYDKGFLNRLHSEDRPHDRMRYDSRELRETIANVLRFEDIWIAVP